MRNEYGYSSEPRSPKENMYWPHLHYYGAQDPVCLSEFSEITNWFAVS